MEVFLKISSKNCSEQHKAKLNWRVVPVPTGTGRFYQAAPQARHEHTRELLGIQELQKKCFMSVNLERLFKTERQSWFFFFSWHAAS